MAGSNVARIVQFLRGKGLPDAAIAAILGNFQVESGFDPTIQNTGEGAIGLGQWEGGRRTALQQYAQAHGGSESDLDMQLGYMWHELETGYSGVLSELRHATDPAAAAAFWDAHYEISSGAARSTRVNNAVAFYNNNLQAGGTDSNNTGGGGGGMTADAAGGGSNGHTSRSELMGVDSLGSLLDQVPELRRLVNQALDNNWTTDKFENAVEDSDWWKNHSQTARSVLITQANDPATYQQNLTAVQQSIAALSRQLGMQLTPDQARAIATSAMLSGNDGNQQWITQQISRREDYSGVTDVGTLQGGMANTAQQLQQLASDYGFKWSPAEIAQRAQNILSGTTTIDTYKARLQSWAESAFPGLTQQLQAGATVRDLADPYIQSMSQLLEVNPGQLSVYTPKIRQALQGNPGKPGETPSPAPLWQFEKELRNDPRWQFTQNAKDTMSSALLQIGQVFGFGPEG